MKRLHEKIKGFTLIELLIVVAIIAILAAIAVPNFLEAQTRAKISRVRAEQRTLDLALESYKVDNNKYPLNLMCGYQDYVQLTTPIAYIESIPTDDFWPDRRFVGLPPFWRAYVYNCQQNPWEDDGGDLPWGSADYGAGNYPGLPMWMLSSWGPSADPTCGAYLLFWV